MPLDLKQEYLESLRRLSIKADPVGTAERRFQRPLWQKQREILTAMVKSPKVTVRSCYSSGKTFTASRAVLNFLDSNWPSKVITTAPTNRQVEKLLWKEINTAYSLDPAYPGRCLNKELDIAPDHFALGFSTEDAVNFQGFHAVDILVVVDEAAGVPLKIHNALKAILTTEGARLLLIGNPDEATGAFSDSFSDPSFLKIKISAFDTPNFLAFGITEEDIENGDWQEMITGPLPAPWLLTPKWVADAYNDWGPSSPLYISRVLAEFPEVSIDGLLGLMAIERAQKRILKPGSIGQFGVDVARFGGDRSVIKYRKGDVCLKTWVFRKMDTVELSNWADGLINQQKDPEAIVVVDAVGVGAGVADMLRDKGHFVVEYTGSGAASSDKFLNERAEFYWHLRSRFNSGEIAGDIDEDTKQELMAIKYVYRNSKIKIQDKDEIKKNLGKSPDYADALMLAFAPIMAPVDGGGDSTGGTAAEDHTIRRGRLWAR